MVGAYPINAIQSRDQRERFSNRFFTQTREGARLGYTDANKSERFGAQFSELLRSAFLAGFILVVVGRSYVEVLGFEDVVAVHAPHVIDPVATHQKFRALVLTARHKRRRLSPILM